MQAFGTLIILLGQFKTLLRLVAHTVWGGVEGPTLHEILPLHRG